MSELLFYKEHKLNMEGFLRASMFNAIEAFIILFNQSVYNLKHFEFKSIEEKNLLITLTPSRQLEFYKYIQILQDIQQLKISHVLTDSMLDFAKITNTEKIFSILQKKQQLDTTLSANEGNIAFLMQRSHLSSSLFEITASMTDEIMKILDKYNTYDKIKTIITELNNSFHLNSSLLSEEKLFPSIKNIKFDKMIFTKIQKSHSQSFCFSTISLENKIGGYYCNETDFIKIPLYKLDILHKFVISKRYDDIKAPETIKELIKKNLSQVDITDIKSSDEVPLSDEEKIKYLSNLVKAKAVKKEIYNKKELIVSAIFQEIEVLKTNTATPKMTDILSIVQDNIDKKLLLVLESNNASLDHMCFDILTQFIEEILSEINSEEYRLSNTERKE